MHCAGNEDEKTPNTREGELKKMKKGVEG